MDMKNDTQSFGPFLGINNRLPDFALNTDKGRWLREADNVDIDNAGAIRRRDGVFLVQAMTGAHSVWEVSSTAGYLVRGGVLYSFSTSPTYAETIVKILSVNDTVHYLDEGGVLYYSNGTDSGKIVAGIWFPWGLPTPSVPAVAATTGTLKPGKYQVAIRYHNSTTGEAGGLSASAVRDVSITGGIRVTLPGATPGATHVQVFVSDLNGSQTYLSATVAAASATADISTLTGRSTTGDSEYVEPLPACTNLFFYKGKLCGAAGSRLFYGAAYYLGYYVPDDGYIDFDDDIFVAIPNLNGVYVVTASATYWLSGDLKAADRLDRPLPYGGIYGTRFYAPHNRLVGWFGKNGFVVGDEMGQVSAITQDAVDVAPTGAACSAVLETRGYRRVVSNGYCVNLENNALTTYSDFAFTSFSGEFGTKADGLYRLSGVQKIDAHASLGKEDFGSELQKSLPACYVGVSSETPMELRVTTPDAEDYRYLTRSCSTAMRVQRIDPGKGLRANWYDLAVHNTDGADFSLASLSFKPAASGRRI